MSVRGGNIFASKQLGGKDCLSRMRLNFALEFATIIKRKVNKERLEFYGLYHIGFYLYVFAFCEAMPL